MDLAAIIIALNKRNRNHLISVLVTNTATVKSREPRKRRENAGKCKINKPMWLKKDSNLS